MTARVRLFTVLRFHNLQPRVRHTLGFPSDLREDADDPQSLPRPHVLVVEEESPSNFFLYRVTKNGEAAGDTWHQSLADATHQAQYEYGDAIAGWSTVPDEVDDALEFAVTATSKRDGDN